MDYLTKYIPGIVIAAWLYALPMNAQALDCVCHANPLNTFCEGDPGYSGHLNHGDTPGACGATDTDGDGFDDDVDNCPTVFNDDQTNTDETYVNGGGVGISGDPQGDACDPDLDADGVPNEADLCDTPPGNVTADGQVVDATGCDFDAGDSDGDGVPNGADLCEPTPPEAILANDETPGVIDADGCSDVDGDGVEDSVDMCLLTPPEAVAEDAKDPGSVIDANGCSDVDGDGVEDSVDACPVTPPGADVDVNGCALPDPGDPVDSAQCTEMLNTLNCVNDERAILLIRNLHRLVWVWRGEFNFEGTGTPAVEEAEMDTENYVYCVYLNGQAVRGADLLPGAFTRPELNGWISRAGRVHVYRSVSALPGGVRVAVLRDSNAPGRDVAKLVSFFPPLLPLDTDSETPDEIVVQLRNLTTGLCLQSTHVEPYRRNDSIRHVSSSDPVE